MRGSGKHARSDQDETGALTPQDPQWQLLPRSAQGRSRYVGWVRPAFFFLYLGIPMSILVLCWDNGSGNRQDDLHFAWSLLALSLGPSFLAALFFLNRFRRRPRGLRMLPPRSPLGEPRPNRVPAGARYPLRSADIALANAVWILAGLLMALVGLALLGAGGAAKEKAGAGLAQWYGGLVAFVGLGWALWSVVAWARGIGRSSFAIVTTPDAIWLPSALRAPPVLWADIADLRRESLEFAYRARLDWDHSNAPFLFLSQKTEECEVDVLTIVGAEGAALAYVPLDELLEPDRFVEQLTALWQSPQLRAELAEPGVVPRLQSS